MPFHAEDRACICCCYSLMRTTKVMKSPTGFMPNLLSRACKGPEGSRRAYRDAHVEIVFSTGQDQNVAVFIRSLWRPSNISSNRDRHLVTDSRTRMWILQAVLRRQEAQGEETEGEMKESASVGCKEWDKNKARGRPRARGGQAKTKSTQILPTSPPEPSMLVLYTERPFSFQTNTHLLRW